MNHRHVPALLWSGKPEADSWGFGKCGKLLPEDRGKVIWSQQEGPRSSRRYSEKQKQNRCCLRPVSASPRVSLYIRQTLSFKDCWWLPTGEGPSETGGHFHEHLLRVYVPGFWEESAAIAIPAPACPLYSRHQPATPILKNQALHCQAWS